jgi:hypothetical protein
VVPSIVPDRRVEAHQGPAQLLVVPPVDRFTRITRLTRRDRELAADERHLLDGRPQYAGTDVPVLGGEPVLPHVGRLDHVVVDRDDLRELTHGPRW